MPTRLIGRGCTDIRRLIDIIEGIRVIGLSASRPHLSAYFVSTVSVFYDRGALYISRFVTRTPAVFAIGTPGKLPERARSGCFF